MSRSVSAENQITQGVIWKQILVFFFPILFGTFFQQLYNTFDAIIVGQFVGKQALAAVGGGTSNLVNIVVNLCTGVAAGTTVVVAQGVGARDPERVRKTVHTSAVMSLVGGLVFTVVGILAARPALVAMATPDDVMEYAVQYLIAYCLGMIPSFFYNVGAGILRAVGDTKRPLYFLIVACLVNIVLDIVFVAVMGMGALGAGLATMISQWVSAALVYISLSGTSAIYRLDKTRLGFDQASLSRVLQVGIPAGIENGMFQIGKLSVASLTSTLGTAAIAANAVANTTSTFLNIPASAVGMAVLTVVGQCLGAGEKEQAVWYARRLLLVAYCGAWVMNLSAFFFADRWALSWFSLSPEASAMALEVMMWFNIVSLFFWPSSFTLPNILRAAGDASFTMTVSIVSMWVFRVGFCYLWVLKMGGGLLSIWMGMYLDWAFRSICFTVRFVRGKWLEQKVI